MSKMIIEKSTLRKLTAANNGDGAEFRIKYGPETASPKADNAIRSPTLRSFYLNA